ncbi:DUF5011 domain-containing protein, partial [Akkermansiaceae bacterium]|nr:DUF5011 domain-containing protein [Akkermansiaceae bacterium]
DSLTITGPSVASGAVTISGDDQHSMFFVKPNNVLNLSALTFTKNGPAHENAGKGGSIIFLDHAHAVATSITVTDNAGGSASAFYSENDSTLTISHSTFSNNSATIIGSNFGSTPSFTDTPSTNRTIVTDSTFESNSGVIFSTERYVMIDRCVFSSNTNTIGDFRGLNAYRVLNSVFTENQHSGYMPLFTFSNWNLGNGWGSFSPNHHLFDGNTFSGNNDENGQSGAALIYVGDTSRFGEVTTISNNTFAVDPSIASYGPVLETLITGASPYYGTNTIEIEYPAPEITVKSRYSVDGDGPYGDYNYNISWTGNSIKIAETFGGSEAWSGELKYIGDGIYVVENATDSSYDDREFIFNSDPNGVYDELIDNYNALYLYSEADAYDVNLFGSASSAPAPVEAGSYLLVNTVSGTNSYDTVMAGFVDSTSPSLKSDDIDNDVGSYGTPQVWSTYGEIYGNYHYEMSALDVNVNDVPVDGYFRMIVSQYGYNPGGGPGDGGPGDGSGPGPGDGSGGGGLSLVTYNQEQNEPPSSGYLDGLTLNFGVEVFGADTTQLNVDPVDLTHQIVLDADQIKDYTIVDFKLNQDKTAVSEVRYNEGTWIHLIEVPLNADGTRIVWAIANGDVHPSPNPNSFTAPEGYEIILDVSGSLEKEYNTNTNTITDLLQLLQNIGNIDGEAYAGLKYIGPDRGPNGNWGTYPGSYAWGAYAKSIDQTAPAAPTQNWPALTNDPTPTLTGTAEADSTVRIYHHGSELGWATADSESGSYSITVPNLSEGSHIITATATDAFGNVSASTMLAVVVDTTAPVITLLGSASPITAEAGFQYIDAGATADGGESVDTSGTVNTSILGDYVLDYTAEDSAGNVGTATRTVNVKDTTKPVIALIGDAEVTILVGTPYQEPGATFSDNYDTELIVTIDNSLVNKDVVGEYTVSYTVTDTSGYEGTAIRTVKVEDQTAPVVTLNGDAQVTIEMGGTYTELGATVSDNYDTTGLDVDVTVTPTEDVNTSAEGTYEITYSVMDVSGNTGTAIRTVTVDDTIAPDAPTLNGPALTKSTTPILTGTAEPGSSVKFYDGVNYLTATDADSESGFFSITASVPAEGSHDITAIATDAAGNPSASTLLTVVVDTTAPTAP